VAVLQQGQAGEEVADICRNLASARERTTHGRSNLRGLGITELRELRQLWEENTRLKRLVVDLSLDRQILREIVPKAL
jgi:putative transposase